MDSPKRFAYLFNRYFDKQCTQQEKDEFFALLHEAEHDVTLRQLISETWERQLPPYQQSPGNALAILANITRQSPVVPLYEAEGLDEQPISSRRRIYLPYAAAVVLVLTLASFLVFYFRSSPAHPVAAAPVNPPADKYLVLSDGSKVMLHQNAHIEYPPEFNGKTREVYLSGEAYFDIRHDARPFIVHTGGIKTTVLGTAFNINALDRNITVTVTKGKVKVENDQGEYSILKRDEQITVDVFHNSLRKKAVNANEVITWKKSYILFNDISMGDAIQELEQRFHATINLRNPALANCSVTASFVRDETLEQIINVLSKINNMEYQMSSPTRIELMGEGCK